jgi:O-antigen ligase
MPQIAQFGSNDPATLGRGARLAGIFEHPNQLGLISGLAIVLGMLSFISEKKYLTLLAITPAFLTIVLSQSYTAWLATICAIVIPTIFSRRERFENGRALHKFVKVLWIVLIVAAAYGVTVTLSSDGNISSISQRQIVWATVLTHWADTPVLGHGVGIWQNLISSGSVPLWAVHAHNQYLNALFVGGLVGLITLMYALLRTAIASWIQLKLGFLTVAGVLTFQIVRSLTEVPFDLSYASISLLTIIIFVASKVRQISP